VLLLVRLPMLQQIQRLGRLQLLPWQQQVLQQQHGQSRSQQTTYAYWKQRVCCWQRRTAAMMTREHRSEALLSSP